MPPTPKTFFFLQSKWKKLYKLSFYINFSNTDTEMFGNSNCWKKIGGWVKRCQKKVIPSHNPSHSLTLSKFWKKWFSEVLRKKILKIHLFFDFQNYGTKFFGKVCNFQNKYLIFFSGIFKRSKNRNNGKNLAKKAKI